MFAVGNKPSLPLLLLFLFLQCLVDRSWCADEDVGLTIKLNGRVIVLKHYRLKEGGVPNDVNMAVSHVKNQVRGFRENHVIDITIDTGKWNDNITDIDGYEYFPGVGYYRFHPIEDAENFDDAAEVCKLDGGEMATVDSQEEYEVLRKVYERVRVTSCGGAWVGYRYDDSSGIYKTLDGKPMKTGKYNKWAFGEPNTLAEKCVALTTGGFNDAMCNVQLPFVCKRTSEGGQDLDYPDHQGTNF